MPHPTDLPRALAACALGAVLVLGTAACDDDDDARLVQPDDDAEYVAILRPLNNSGVTGTATFVIDEGTIQANVAASGLAPSMIHPQHIHAAANCPTMAADTNGDNFVDVLEGVPAYGNILVPLDANLSSQAAASSDFPVANASGVITYVETADFDEFLADLRAADPNPNDALVKLGPNADLNLSTRTVVLHGVAPSTNLPASVATLPDVPANVSLPVACGTIVRID